MNSIFVLNVFFEVKEMIILESVKPKFRFGNFQEFCDNSTSISVTKLHLCTYMHKIRKLDCLKVDPQELDV